MFCKKCGKEIPDDSDFCSFCGIPLSDSIKPTQKAISQKHIFFCFSTIKPIVRKSIAIAIAFVSVILVIVGIKAVTSSDYSYEIEAYKECMAGYNECMDKAKTEGYYFKAAYEDIADDWMEMAQGHNSKIMSMRVEAGVFISIAALLFAVALLFFCIKGKTKVFIPQQESEGTIQSENDCDIVSSKDEVK